MIIVRLKIVFYLGYFVEIIFTLNNNMKYVCMNEYSHLNMIWYFQLLEMLSLFFKKYLRNHEVENMIVIN